MPLSHLRTAFRALCTVMKRNIPQSFAYHTQLWCLTDGVSYPNHLSSVAAALFVIFSGGRADKRRFNV